MSLYPHNAFGMQFRGARVGAALHAFGADANGVIKGLVTKLGSMAFARTSEATLTDFEGLVKTALEDELRFVNARRVHNTIPKSNDFADGAWVASGVTKNGLVAGAGPNGEDAYSITFNSSQLSYLVNSDLYPDGELACVPIWVRAASGSASVRLRCGTTAMISGDINIDTTWRRLSYSFAAPIGNNARGIMNSTGGTAGTVYLYRGTTEHVGGQTNQNPGEDVVTNELAYPYQGVGADGVSYFGYENGNTVSGNVVTEAKGSALTDWYALFEPLAINECLYSDDFSNAAWVASNITKSSDGVALPNGRAGTAETLTASAGNATLLQTITLASQVNNFSIYLQRKTGTGNVDITLDNGATWTTKALTGVGTWDRVNVSGAAAANPVVGIRIVTSGDAVQAWRANLIAGAFPLSPIGTVATPVTRTADDGKPFAQISGNVDPTKGTLIVDWIPQFDYTDDPGGNAGLISLDDASVLNLLYNAAGAGVISSTDGTNTLAQAINWVKGKRYRLTLRWAAGGTFGLAWRNITDAGAWSSWDSAVFDDTFTFTSNINIADGGLGDGFRDLQIFLADQGEAWIEANY